MAGVFISYSPDKPVAGVFISYSPHGAPFVQRLYAALRKADVPAWVDLEGISPSAPWMEEIQSAIGVADTLIYVLSPESLQSEWTQSELTYALSQGKRVVPVVARAVAPDDTPPALRSLNWISFTSPDDFDMAFRRLLGALGAAAPRAATKAAPTAIQRVGAAIAPTYSDALFSAIRRPGLLAWLSVIILLIVVVAGGGYFTAKGAAPGSLLGHYTLPSWTLTAASLVLNLILLGALLVGWLRRRVRLMQPEATSRAAQGSGIVFISYSRSDSEFVDKLEDDLLGERFKTWVDRRKLEGGQVWDAEIERAIERCQLLLVVLSPDALQSRWVRQEYVYAMKRNKLVIPIIYHPCQSVPRKLARLQLLDFKAGLNFDAKYRFAFGQLVARLDAIALPRVAVAA